jgi:plasmid rolling circle replication initiator protein Rep
MAKICQISEQTSGEISQNFNTIPLCSYLETFDTTPEIDLSKPIPKKWENKQRRKFTTDVTASRLMNFELTLSKEHRGLWNSKIARQYVPDLIMPELLPWEEQPTYLEFRKNKYGEPIFIPTDEERIPDLYYNHSNNVGNQLRWKRMIKCHSSIKEYKDSTTQKTIYKATYKCNDKLCLLCSQIRSRVAIIKYQDKVNDMIDPVMVVLHQKSPGIGQLKGSIDNMYSDWRSILKVEAKSKNESLNGILALEVTTNDKNQTYHPHYHIIIERSQAKRLVNLWIAKDSETRSLYAHTNKMTGKVYTELEKDQHGKVAIHELFKYAMKMSVTNEDKPGETQKTIGSTEMIYEIAKALKGIQQWRPFGNFRATKTTKEITQAIQDEMSVSREDHPHIELSKEWNWNGMDWEAYDMPGMTLIGKRLSDGSIAFLRLTKEEYNNFVNEKRNQFERSPGYEIIETPWENEGIQNIPRSETIERSI